MTPEIRYEIVKLRQAELRQEAARSASPPRPRAAEPVVALSLAVSPSASAFAYLRSADVLRG